MACWAHARLKWDEACTTDPVRSHFVLALVQQLYAIEREIKGSSEAETFAARQTRSVPVLPELQQWLETDQPNLFPKGRRARRRIIWPTSGWH